MNQQSLQERKQDCASAVPAGWIKLPGAMASATADTQAAATFDGMCCPFGLCEHLWHVLTCWLCGRSASDALPVCCFYNARMKLVHLKYNILCTSCSTTMHTPSINIRKPLCNQHALGTRSDPLIVIWLVASIFTAWSAAPLAAMQGTCARQDSANYLSSRGPYA